MRMLFAGGLCLGLIVPLGAWAATAKADNPVVDLSNLMAPGLWQTTTVNTVNGAAGKPSTDTGCITAQDLRDFLNQGDTAQTKIEEYSLKGKHLYVKGSGTNVPMSFQEDIYFESRDQMHGTVTLTQTGDSSATMTTEINSRRISATCPKDNGGS